MICRALTIMFKDHACIKFNTCQYAIFVFIIGKIPDSLKKKNTEMFVEF